MKLALFATLALAAGVTAQVDPNTVDACIKGCTEQAAGSVGCDPLDAACLCGDKRGALTNAALTCLTAQCPDKLGEAAALQGRVCSEGYVKPQPSAEPSSAAPEPSSAAPEPSSAAPEPSSEAPAPSGESSAAPAPSGEASSAAPAPSGSSAAPAPSGGAGGGASSAAPKPTHGSGSGSGTGGGSGNKDGAAAPVPTSRVSAPPAPAATKPTTEGTAAAANKPANGASRSGVSAELVAAAAVAVVLGARF